MSTIGQNIKALREKCGYTQDAFAEAVDVNRVTLAKYEADQSVPGGKILLRMSRVLHVSADAILDTGEPDMTDDEKDLWQMREDIRRNPELRTLFDLQRKATKSELRQMEAFIRAIRSSNDHED